MDFKVGDTHQVSQITPNGRKFYKIHILAVVDQCQIVFKWYGKHKQWWHYEVKSAEWLEQDIKIAKAKKSESRRGNNGSKTDMYMGNFKRTGPG